MKNISTSKLKINDELVWIDKWIYGLLALFANTKELCGSISTIYYIKPCSMLFPYYLQEKIATFCLWYSWVVQHHYQIKEWRPCTNIVPEKFNVIVDPLVVSKLVILRLCETPEYLLELSKNENFENSIRSRYGKYSKDVCVMNKEKYSIKTLCKNRETVSG